jgi:AcrR family transcriptional regulator
MAENRVVDGRKARGLRTRDAIVTALLELAEEGDVGPSAQQIAARAGVSVRSVYQHLSDVEGLYAEAAARAAEAVRAMANEIDPSWPLTRRIEEFTLNRAVSLEKARPITRAGLVTEATSPVVRESRQKMNEWQRERIAHIFAGELEGIPEPVATGLVAAIDSLSCADMWVHWRSIGYNPQEAHQIMQVGVAAILAGARPSPAVRS